MAPRDEDPAKVTPIRPATRKRPPKLFGASCAQGVRRGQQPGVPGRPNDVEQVG
jgi:hypothetical protein